MQPKPGLPKEKKVAKTTTDQGNRSEPAVSTVLDDGRLVELLRCASTGKTSFAIWQAGKYTEQQSLKVGDRLLRPYSAQNNILKHKVVLLPSGIEDYGDEDELIGTIEAFLDRFVDLSPEFKRLTCRYILLTWLYDRFNELPYLRLRGDYGTGKTRFLLVVGSLCYKPIFANGASTISPLFHLLDSFQGTLILDEADFRFSDEKADMVKILNAGNVRGIPILRSMIIKDKEFDPRAFSIFGPKLIAGRSRYEDPALESRCITEETEPRKLRKDIPINLPDAYAEEAQILRNKLLHYRFQNFHKTAIDPELVNPAVDNRINQIYLPLLTITKDKNVQEELHFRQQDSQQRLSEERGFAIEAQVLEVVRDLVTKTSLLRLRDIAGTFEKCYGDDYPHAITSRFIGSILRTKLYLRTQKSHGIYILPASEFPKLPVLFARYGIVPVDKVEDGDIKIDPS